MAAKNNADEVIVKSSSLRENVTMTIGLQMKQKGEMQQPQNSKI